jgi:tetratricopeptide (TPR) repeat protein
VHLLILGGSPDDRRRFALAHVPRTHVPILFDSETLPFVRARDATLPPSPRVLLLHDLEQTFPNEQAGGIRLVLTQSTYLLQTWIDRLAEGDRIIATADRAALERCAPEALRARGPWGNFEVINLDTNTEDTKNTKDTKGTALFPSSVSFVRVVSLVPDQRASRLMARAYASRDGSERLRLCREATSLAPDSPVAWLSLASACRETRDAAGAREALEHAAALAPDWEAVHYERGKLWLADDDMARAREGFQHAADLMPTFSAAFSNLGATLGELDETDAARAAFEQALAHDPRSFTIWNNVGVVLRELGRLDESAEAFHRVIEIAPEFVFGHYNLGHTLFLAGEYAGALRAYEEGQRRDPEKNRRQGCRLAIVRLVNGDVAGAERDFWRFADAAPPDERDDLLLEAYEIAGSFAASHPHWRADAADSPYRAFLDRVAAGISKSSKL